jgi:hypothetical protein
MALLAPEADERADARDGGGHRDADGGNAEPEPRVEHSSGSLEWRCRDRIRRWAREGSLQNGGLDAGTGGPAVGPAEASGPGSSAASGELLPGAPAAAAGGRAGNGADARRSGAPASHGAADQEVSGLAR